MNLSRRLGTDSEGGPSGLGPTQMFNKNDFDFEQYPSRSIALKIKSSKMYF